MSHLHLIDWKPRPPRPTVSRLGRRVRHLLLRMLTWFLLGAAVTAGALMMLALFVFAITEPMAPPSHAEKPAKPMVAPAARGWRGA